MDSGGDGAGADSETLTRAAVERLGVPFEMLPCDPDFADTAAFCARYGYAPETAANTIIVASKKAPRRYAACVVLATTRLDGIAPSATSSARRSARSPPPTRCTVSPA